VLHLPLRSLLLSSLSSALRSIVIYPADLVRASLQSRLLLVEVCCLSPLLILSSLQRLSALLLLGVG
jgi:hypothetical protein